MSTCLHFLIRLWSSFAGRHSAPTWKVMVLHFPPLTLIFALSFHSHPPTHIHSISPLEIATKTFKGKDSMLLIKLTAKREPCTLFASLVPFTYLKLCPHFHTSTALHNDLLACLEPSAITPRPPRAEPHCLPYLSRLCNHCTDLIPGCKNGQGAPRID